LNGSEVIAAPAEVVETKDEVLEKKRLEDLARIESAKRIADQAAMAQAKEAAAERQRLEELEQIEAAKRIAEQSAMAKAKEAAERKEAALEKERLEELAQIEAAKRIAEQAAMAKAKEAAERKLPVENGKVAVQKTAPVERLPEKSGDNSANGEHGVAQQFMGGRELAARAMDQARKLRLDTPGNEPSEVRQRRGSIFGRESKDIQLAFYGESWRQKVERIGSMNYPKLSKNRIYEPLVTTVSINSDGTLNSVRIEKSSGDKNLDEAVRRIVEMSAPFAAFPPSLKRNYDVVDITRSWQFLEERPRISSE
jgi:TolA protein